MFNFDDEDDKKIEFSYSDDDFNSEGKLSFKLLPEYKEKCDKYGNITNLKEFNEFNEVKDRNETLRKYSEYQDYEPLWENYNRLSPNQQRAATLFITGKPIRDIASYCEVNEATIYRWLQLDIFTKTLKLWQKKLLIEADTKVNSLISKALDRLEYILDNPTKFDSKDYVRSIELCLNFMDRGDK